MKFSRLVAPILIVGLSPLTMAATNGTLGSTSSGDSTVSITLPDNVQVQVQQDVSFTYVQGQASYTGSTGICIYHRGVSTAALTLSTSKLDAGNPTNFNMQVGNTGDFLPYSVSVSGGVGAVTNGQKTTGVSAHTTSVDCDNGGGPTFPHSVDISVSGAAADAVAAGAYTDTLVILVEPS